MEVWVDFREAALLAHLRNVLKDINDTETTLLSKNLELGDIQIVGPNGPILFERKTYADLASSIVDGRYSEQKARILSVFPPHLCTYIIECDGWQIGDTRGGGGASVTSVEGAIIHTMFRDKMHVVQVRDTLGTAMYIKTVLAKYKANPKYFVPGTVGTVDTVGGTPGSASEYIATLKHKSRKIDNIDKHTCYLLQLCQIPGISHKVAGQIALAFPTWTALLGALNTCADDKERITLLKKVDMVADKKAKTILEYVL